MISVRLPLIAIGLAACVHFPQPAAAQDDELNRGARIVGAQCSRCHATGRTDASADPQAPPFRTLSRKYPLHFLAEALAEGIVTGHNDMPPFVFDPAEIDAILAYIGSISDQGR